MITNRGSVAIDVPIDEVFDFLADARNEPRWLPGASDVRLTSGEPIGPGTTFTGDYARAGTINLRVDVYDRPNRIALSGDGKTLRFTDEIELTPVAAGTALSATMTTEPKGILRLFAPMMGRVIGKQFQSNWQSLKTVLESRAASA